MERSNNALNINPPNANRHLTTSGSDWLWAVTAVFGIALLSWLAWTLMRHKAQNAVANTAHPPKNNGNVNDHLNNGVHRQGNPLYGERILHYLWTLAAFIGFIAYFTMASDLGSTPVRQYLHNGGNSQQTRQIFYVRYIFWFLAWPLVLTANLLVAGVSWATILFIIALQEIWVVSWLSGALVRTSYKWGYFAFDLFAYFILAYLLLSWGMQHAKRVLTHKTYTPLAGFLVLLWAIYPISWGLSEGANRLSVTGEMVFYGILDLITIPIYGTLFLILSKRVASNHLNFTQTGRVGYTDNINGAHSNVESGVPAHSTV